ncbi:MAG: ATP-dependent DNA helicase RecG [Chloroflexi bacterium]|nr:ATP-dependent DNA helicase RecG [Chloroflexota bacterium]
MSSIETLRRIIELERTRNYDDKAVMGGLGSFLRRWTAELTVEDKATLSRFQQLATEGAAYSTWPKTRRKDWSGELAACLGMAWATPKAQAARPARRNSSTAPPPTLDSAISTVKSLNASMAEKLGKLGVQTMRDLLYLFPRRHIDYSQRKRISELVEGQDQTIIANVWQADARPLGRMRGTEAVVGDETGNIRVVWFNQPYLAQRLTANSRVVISGKVSVFRGERLFESPEWEILEEKDLVHTGRLVPVYPLTRGLYPRQMRGFMKRILDTWAWQAGEFLPGDTRQRCGLLQLPEALHQAHFPDSSELKGRARERLAFDELLLLQLGVQGRRREWQEDQQGHPLGAGSGALDRFMGLLPFILTAEQRKALEEILADIGQSRPMCRLLQGDVGSGKTVVATSALVVAADNGCQGALMAPTQILAEQHFRTLARLLPPEDGGPEDRIFRHSGLMSRPITIALLTGNTREKQKDELCQRISAGKVDVVIGTHALIQESVEFNRLAMVVVDEQHRFGVMQRSALRQKGFNPHMLVMTATPIPRTLALTLYGDLDVSTINQLPPGRQKVKTKWLDPEKRSSAYEFVRKQVREGHQAFVVCPLIEESEVIEARAAVTEHERLSREVFPDLKLDMLHGRMSGAEKEDIMRRFKAHEFDILVSTPVVEVGIDVPNATVMLVEGADRFGLSQLHQFRGRVGRGEAQSYCMLLAEKPSDEARERLAIIEWTYDGFALAEEDMRLRGPGEFFGTRQSGLPDLRMARLTDMAILEKAREEALRIFQKDPELQRPEHQALSKEMARMWKHEAERS